MFWCQFFFQFSTEIQWVWATLTSTEIYEFKNIVEHISKLKGIVDADCRLYLLLKIIKKKGQKYFSLPVLMHFWGKKKHLSSKLIKTNSCDHKLSAPEQFQHELSKPWCVWWDWTQQKEGELSTTTGCLDMCSVLTHVLQNGSSER